ncbi:MAG TPA: phosphatidylglycerophosphatase A [Candidatus Binataceae bacterium]|nr:phosphatidylglycerophosphatase A [Candidatus Binataceae bacterium]
MRWLIILIASGLFTGYSPIASGTAGSVVGVALSWLVFVPLWERSPWLALLIFAIAFAIACWIAGRGEVIFDEHDSPKIVIDEVLGMVFTMFGNPVTPAYYAVGFVLFRIADVVKPPPAKYIDTSIGGGLGVMLDDLAAAVYANIGLQILRAIIHLI